MRIRKPRSDGGGGGGVQTPWTLPPGSTTLHHLYLVCCTLEEYSQLIWCCVCFVCFFIFCISLFLSMMVSTFYGRMYQIRNTNKPLLVGFTLTQTSLLPLARTPSSKLASRESLKKGKWDRLDMQTWVHLSL